MQCRMSEHAWLAAVPHHCKMGTELHARSAESHVQSSRVCGPLRASPLGQALQARGPRRQLRGSCGQEAVCAYHSSQPGEEPCLQPLRGSCGKEAVCDHHSSQPGKEPCLRNQLAAQPGAKRATVNRQPAGGCACHKLWAASRGLCEPVSRQLGQRALLATFNSQPGQRARARHRR